ncbi:MAG: hypothetical protein OQK35_05105 [Alphaproteobacteria bacterium]|nr:hypothetical protein [Rhodospirillales bacterium]MCW9045691.1 hypothetical protein [Alphaproteobacteria bacterium]
MKFLKLLLIPMMGLTLVGCAYQDIVQSPDHKLFMNRTVAPEGSAKAVAAADWTKAEKVTITLDKYGFKPMFVELNVGQPYIFVFENADKAQRSVAGDEFFDTLALKSLSGNELVAPNARIQNIDLEDMTTRELRAIPLEKGRFEIADGGKGFTAWGWHLNPFKYILGYPSGFMIVQ